MASTYTVVNISHMNTKQLQKVARDVGVNPVTVIANGNQNMLGSSNGRSALITAIKAK